MRTVQAGFHSENHLPSLKIERQTNQLWKSLTPLKLQRTRKTILKTKHEENLKTRRNKQKITPNGGKEKGWELIYSSRINTMKIYKQKNTPTKEEETAINLIYTAL